MSSSSIGTCSPYRGRVRLWIQDPLGVSGNLPMKQKSMELFSSLNPSLSL